MSQIATRTVPRTYQAAATYLQFIANVASAVLGMGVSILLGFNPLPASFPLLSFFRGYSLAATGIGIGLIALAMAAVAVSPRERAFAWISTAGGARVARFLLSTLVSALGSAVLSVLLGLGGLPSTIPLLNLIRTHPPVGIGLIVVLLVLIIFAPLFAFPQGEREEPRHRGPSPLLVSISISTMSSALFAGLLVTVLTRPAWCPTAICPPPLITHNPGASYDANLEIFPTAVQSTTFVIPGDPTRYSIAQSKLPEGVAAWRIDEVYPPYRAVAGVRSLLLGAHDEMVIEQVQVVLDHVTAVPDPLNVWYAGTDRDYGSNPYGAIYRGEPEGSILQAFSLHTPVTQTILREGETDDIDVQLSGKQAAQIRFHIRIVYRLTTQASLRTLDLRQPFDVVFGSAANWHVYQPFNGTFAPQG